MRRSGWFLLLTLVLLQRCVSLSSASTPAAAASSTATAAAAAAASTNTWVVLVSTSRYWFNYRHTANALSLYRIVKAAGVPDSNILLMLPDDFACQPRNGHHSATMFNSQSHSINLYSEDDVEVDYRGSAVSVESFLRLLTGRHSSDVAKRQRLLSDERSNVLLYVSGHGGNEFLKFQDHEELSATDIALALQAMYAQRRFSRLLMVSDTCQAESLHAHVSAPGVASLAASRVGENSYSSGVDPSVGLSLIDRFTDSMLEFFERRQAQHHHSNSNSNRSSGSSSSWMARVSVAELVGSLDPNRLLSHPVTRTDLLSEPLSRTPLNAFFAADHKPHLSSSRTDSYPSTPLTASSESSRRSAAPLSTASVSAAAPSTSALRRQLLSSVRPSSHGSTSAAVWPAVAAAACTSIPALFWLIEQWHSESNSKPRMRTVKH